MRRSLWHLLWFAVMAGPMPMCAPAQEAPPWPFLRNVIQLDRAQLTAVEKGSVVTKLLPSTEKFEIVVFGVVKTAGTQDLLLHLARDIRKFRKAPHILQLGRFSQPPLLQDLNDLTLPAEDLASLKECKPGTCELKLTTKELALASRIEWSAPDAGRQATAIFNQGLVELVAAYALHGAEAMSEAFDRKTSRTRAHEYRMLLARSPYLADYVKEFHDYLADYPNGTLAEVEDILYWSQDNFGVKPVISANHMTLHREPRGVLIANKLIAATRYFEASLEVLAGAPTPDGNGLYLLDLYRARLDIPAGMLAGIVMNKVKSGAETAMREDLEAARGLLATGRVPAQPR